jgi:hypothetical protein
MNRADYRVGVNSNLGNPVLLHTAVGCNWECGLSFRDCSLSALERVASEHDRHCSRARRKARL